MTQLPTVQDAAETAWLMEFARDHFERNLEDVLAERCRRYAEQLRESSE